MSTGSSKTHKRSSVVNCDCGMRALFVFLIGLGAEEEDFMGVLSWKRCNFFQWYDKEDDNGVVEDLKDDLEMLQIKIRKFEIENKELKELVKSLKKQNQ
ncbi:hypothetical protein GQ457_15G013890 [Hibiscus cannabinus]